MRNFYLFRKTIVFGLAFAFMLGIAACGNKTTDGTGEVSEEIKAFVETEDGYNSSIYNALEKYGCICVKVKQDYSDGDEYSYTIYTNGDDVAVDYGEDGIQVLYGGKIYEMYQDEDGEMCYAVYATYKDDSSVAKEDFIDMDFQFDPQQDYDISLVKESDGSYTWTSSFPSANDQSENGYATSTVSLNDKYEIVKAQTTFYCEDGSIYCNETDEYAPGVENTGIIAQLTEVLDNTEGKTRHITFHEVKNGKVTGDVWELDVPVGFECGVSFPEEYSDEEGIVYIYTDETLTEKVIEPDRYADVEYYIQAK